MISKLRPVSERMLIGVYAIIAWNILVIPGWAEALRKLLGKQLMVFAKYLIS